MSQGGPAARVRAGSGAFNVIDEPIIRVELASGATERLTLPQVFAALVVDRVETWPALRPHQAPAWHAFLVQIAAMGLEAVDSTEPPGDDDVAWADVLRALTPKWPNDEPWCLVTPPACPALLQAPVAETALAKYDREFKNHVRAPDALDMLVTTKNHDLKAERMEDAAPDDWLFALVSLQTQGGYTGPRLYGIARMNSGYGNRSYLSFRSADASVGTAFRRDLVAVASSQNALWDAATTRGLGTDEAIALLWTVPWDGEVAMPLSRLHPLFVEICRRVRLEYGDEKLSARTASSKERRVDADALKGDLADPWTPVERSDSPKALSIAAEGLSYRRMSELLFGSDKRSWRLPFLAKPHGRESASASQIVAAGIARGQGKTEGFHRRVVDIPRRAVSLMETGDETIAARGQERVRQAGEVQGKCLRPALIVLVQKGPANVEWTKPTNTSLTKPWIEHFEAQVDSVFFPALWQSLDMTDDDASHSWSRTLANLARRTLEAAAEAAPRADDRRIIAQARARNLLEGALRQHLPNLDRAQERME